MSEVRTINDSLIGMRGEMITASAPLRIGTRQEAYRAAAWILVLAEVLKDDGTAHTFDEVFVAVRAT